MPLKVQKQSSESSQNVVRRFNQRIRRSGILFEARKRQFVSKPQTGQLKKRSALRREKKKKEYEIMKKLGKKKYKRS